MLPFCEKYRPKHLDTILGNKTVIESLLALIKSDCLPHMLFYGPPGTGKTTTIRAVSRLLYDTTSEKLSSCVLELNASDERGIDTVRDTIKSFSQTCSFTNQRKLVILDEADSMSRDAQNAMRRIIEDYSKNVRFCLIANYSTKIIPAILSRCSKFRFNPVFGNVEFIENICNLEGIEYEKGGILTLLDLAQGDMRKLLNDLEGVKNTYGKLTAENISNLNGIISKTEYNKIYEFLKINKYEDNIDKIMQISKDLSIDCDSLVNGLSLIILERKEKNYEALMNELAEIQYRLSFGCTDEIQLRSVAAVFSLYD